MNDNTLAIAFEIDVDQGKPVGLVWDDMEVSAQI